MSGSISRRLVTEGLIYYLDAANPESFISGNTQWNSMDVNKNFVTLVNGPQYLDDFKGIIRFDGTDDALSQSQLFSPSIRNGNAPGETPDIDFELTFEVIFRLIGDGVIGGTLTNFVKTTSTSGGLQPILLYKTTDPVTNRLISVAQYMSTGGTKVSVQTSPNPNYVYDVNKWYHLTMSMRKTSPTTGEWLLVRNGIVLVQQTLNDISWWGNSSNTLNDFGNRMQASPSGPTAPFFQHDMAIMRVYRKGLTVDECLQNYNALKKRFKLE
jgi:hypothetical protein